MKIEQQNKDISELMIKYQRLVIDKNLALLL